MWKYNTEIPMQHDELGKFLTQEEVKFLAQIDLEPVEDPFEEMELPAINKQPTIESGKIKDLKELLDEYMDKHKDLKELEEELEKNKDDITPGQIGES